MTFPANVSTPGMSGRRGCDRNPVAVSSRRPRTVAPSLCVTTHAPLASSQTARSTETPKRMYGRSS